MNDGDLARAIDDPPWAFRRLLSKAGRLHFISDELAMKYLFRLSFGRRLDLDHPVTFNEKLQWLKLHDRKPLYITLADKIAVKDWVAERIGYDHIVPTYATWDAVDDIDLDKLPRRFVLKTNHDSGGVVVCRDKFALDLNVTRKKLHRSMKRNYYWRCREWPYRDITPKVFAEKLLEPDVKEGGLMDFKFMCFGGKARLIFVCSGRENGDLRIDVFDCDWNHLSLSRPDHPNADVAPEKPQCFEDMILAAERLAQVAEFIRVDFFEVEDSFFFGELTLYPAGGFEKFDPPEWDKRLGEMVDLGAVWAEGDEREVICG